VEEPKGLPVHLMSGYEQFTKAVMYSFSGGKGSNSRKRLNVGNKNGSYFKRAFLIDLPLEFF